MVLVKCLLLSLGSLSRQRKFRHECIATLVDGAEWSVILLPYNCSALLGGFLVRALLVAHWAQDRLVEGNKRIADALLMLNRRQPELKVGKKVGDAARGLFLRGMVNFDVSDCGYGDFLVWTSMPVEVGDPFLWDHEINYFWDKSFLAQQ